MKKKFSYVLQPILIALCFFSLTTVGFSRHEGVTGFKDGARNYKSISGDTINYADEKFLVAAAENSLEEIMFSQLAQQNSTMTEVKEFAKTVGSTQTNNLNKIKAFASEGHVIVPSALNEQSNKAYKKLGNKMGSEFDKEYSDWVVANYKENIALFEKISMDGGDDGIKSWTLTALPELRTQLDQAIQIQKKCNKM